MSKSSTMASEVPVDDRRVLVVQGYVRRNFEETCWVKEIISIILGYYMNMVIGGSLFCFGYIDYAWAFCKDMSKTRQRRFIPNPTIVPPFDKNKCADVACYSHALMIDTQGKLYASGETYSFRQPYRLGTGHAKSLKIPTVTPIPSVVVRIAVGKNHSLLATNSGSIYSFGSSSCGQLGHGNGESVIEPKLIEHVSVEKVVEINCGDSHSAAITADGKLFMWGNNKWSQCGLGIRYRRKNIYIPTEVTLEYENKKLLAHKCQCGESHSLILTTSNKIMSCGYNDDYQLGYTPKNDVGHTPKVIMWCMSDIAAGSCHSLAISNHCRAYSWGRNSHGQLGHKSKCINNQTKPKEIAYFVEEGIEVIACFAGDYHSAILSSSNELYLFGCNNNGQIGFESFSVREIRRPRKLEVENVQKVSLGDQCSAIIVKQVD